MEEETRGGVFIQEGEEKEEGGGPVDPRERAMGGWIGGSMDGCDARQQEKQTFDRATHDTHMFAY